MDLYQLVADLCRNPKHTRWIAPLLILADAVLCGLIIWKVPCEYYSLLHADLVGFLHTCPFLLFPPIRAQQG